MSRRLTACAVWTRPVLRGIVFLLAGFSFFSGKGNATPRFDTPTLYLRGDTLTVDIRVDSLFSKRAQDAIASGMTTSIEYEFLLEPDGPIDATRLAIGIQLDHDIWEGQYRVIRNASQPDTLVTRGFVEATTFCTDLSGLRLGPLSDEPVPLVLKVRVHVNPISPEQEARTRRWLNLLDRGSVLELFFSLGPRGEGVGWIEIARFRKSDLPATPPFLKHQPLLEGTDE